MARRPRGAGNGTTGGGGKGSAVIYIAAAMGVAVLALLAYLIFHPPGDKSAEPSPVATTPDAVAAQARKARLDAALESVERLCLSSYSETIKNDVKAKLVPSLTKGIGADAGSAQKREVLRGAINSLADDKREAANARISDCMTKNLETIIDTLTPEGERATARANPLKTYFALATNSAGENGFEHAKLRLKNGNEPIIDNDRTGDGEWITRRGNEPFWIPLRLPRRGDRIDGTLVPAFEETKGAAPPPARLCFELGKLISASSSSIFARFDCVYGGRCTISESSPAWLADADCEQKQVAQSGMFVRTAWAAEPLNRWAVPSIESWGRLQDGQVEGVGITEFAVETDAFADRRVYAVSIDIAINGTPVLVDGLAARDRPSRTVPGQPLRYAVGFRTLDLQGKSGGCDRIDVILTPHGSAAAKPIRIGGDIVALRPLKSQRIVVPGGGITVSTKYYRPRKAFERELFLLSAVYTSEEDRVSKRSEAIRLKDSFDALGLRYNGTGPRLVGVVRPPLRKPAYAVAVGIVNERGQVGFTFPPNGPGLTAGAIKAYIKDLLGKDARVREIVRSDMFVYPVGNDQAANVGTPAGICRNFEIPKTT